MGVESLKAKMESPFFGNTLTSIGQKYASGDTVPTDGTSGYAYNCEFRHNDGSGVGEAVYRNIGTSDLCKFVTASGMG